MYKYSVIVPVYNASNTIERCVKSILAAGGDLVEIILINDCSGDNSLEIIRELEKKYQNIKVLHNEVNKGVSHTRNRGLEAAEGEYILFVDSDDYVDVGYVQAFDKILAVHPEQFVICGFVNHDEKYNGRTDIYRWDGFEGYKEYSFKEQAQILYDRTLLQQLWNKVFVAKVIKENHVCFDETISIGEDFRFILHYLEKAEVKKIMLLNQPLYHYMRDQDGSLMYRVGYESVEEPLKNLDRMYRLINLSSAERNELVDKKRRELTELYAYLIMHNAGMPGKEKRHLILQLDGTKGKKLYMKNRVIFWKERCVILLKKFSLKNV